MVSDSSFDDEAQQQALIEWENAWTEQTTIPAPVKPDNPVLLVNGLMMEVSR